jgi:uncharacterized protein (DUF1499 family)
LSIHDSSHHCFIFVFAECGKLTNCFRLAGDSNDNQDEGLTPFEVRAQPSKVFSSIKEWISSQSSTSTSPLQTKKANIQTFFFFLFVAILKEESDFVHAEFVTAFWGFSDDFYAATVCTVNGTLVKLQSASRLGTGDFGVNRKRGIKILDYLKDQKFPEESCM